MGCVSSKSDINKQHPNIFQVTNVNDQYANVSPGMLEVTETELILHQRSKLATVWPLRALRKYGLEADIFTFECGRRCPTGAGIYAFRCRKADQLFNIVQQRIARNSNDEGANAPGDFPIPTTSTGPPVQRRPATQADGYLTAVSGPTPRPHPLSRPGSITSNGQVSPTTLSPPPVEVALEHNNNKRGSLIGDHAYTNNGYLTEVEAPPNYANVGAPQAPETEGHLYMNVDTIPKETEEEDVRHCYANIDTKDLELLRPGLETPVASVPQTPTGLYTSIHEVNYAELDLDPGKEAPVAPQVPPDSPRAKKSYATIDFQRTNALSQSINPRMEVEEGSRKTRHNSTISDVTTTTRHSNSLSD